MCDYHASRVTSAVSGKTSYLVAGAEPGEKKVQKAQQLKVKIIDEDAFLELIRTRPGKATEVRREGEAAVGIAKAHGFPTRCSFRFCAQPPKGANDFAAVVQRMSPKKAAAAPAAKPVAAAPTAPTPTAAPAPTTTALPASGSPAATELWTEKYRPRTRKDLIGNPGLADKLFTWLQKWFRHRRILMVESLRWAHCAPCCCLAIAVEGTTRG